jgi:hypothetical protein
MMPVTGNPDVPSQPFCHVTAFHPTTTMVVHHHAANGRAPGNPVLLLPIRDLVPHSFRAILLGKGKPAEPCSLKRLFIIGESDVRSGISLASSTLFKIVLANGIAEVPSCPTHLS